MAQGLEVVLDAAQQLRENSRVRFVMIGDGPVKPQLLRDQALRRLENVVFLDPRPKAEMPAIIASCDASLVPLATRLPGTMPSKAF